MLLSLCTFAMFINLIGLVSFLDCLNKMQLKKQFNVTREKIKVVFKKNSFLYY